MLTLDKVFNAQTVLKNIIRETNVVRAYGIAPDCELYLKPENLQITGSFKVRGSAYKIAMLSEEEKAKGVIACSAGNHAQGVALAATKNGIKSLICLPDTAPISKVEATKGFGAKVCLVEGCYDDAYAKALELRDSEGYTFVHPFDRRNRGEVDQYYVSNSHEAVLDKDTFAAVQEMLKKNLEKEALKAAPQKYFFSGKIFCMDCGWAYKRRVQNDIVYWVCSKSGTAGQHCCTHPLSEEVIGKTFCNMYNKLRQYENELLKSTLTRLVELKAAVTKSRSEVIDIDEKLIKLADRLAFYTEQYEAGVIDDGVYNDRTIADRKKVSELRTRRNKLLTDDEDEQCIDELRQLILYLESQPKAILSFNENIFDGVVERVTVEEDKLCFEIKSGILLKEVIAWN